MTCWTSAAGVTPAGFGSDVDLAGLQREADHRPAIAVVLERPQLEEARAGHPLVGALVLGGLVIDDLAGREIEAEHQAKVFGRAGLRS
jgi:hypothetical protein